jgi:prepilin-type N-terminal cleavage/methylation domain-containing protein
MKTRPIRRASRGFTLVELLVVISIIIVLAAMSLGGVQIATKRAKTLQTQSDAMALQQAIEQYYQEYSKLPGLGATSDEIQTRGEAGVELLTILLGKEDDTGTMQNPRKLAFLNVKESRNAKKGGLVYSNGGAGGQIDGLYDAWGRPFNVRLDNDYEGEIPDPLIQGNVVRNRNSLVYSFGQDGRLGTDDVKTW